MGIKGLSALLSQQAPGSMHDGKIQNYFGRKIAIDASMTLYQFLIAVRQGGVDGALTNDHGEVTSHLIGLFYRTIRMMEHGIKPVYVFDGKPPDLKGEELRLRRKRREEAERERKEAEEAGETARVAQMERRLVKVSKEHCTQAKELLDLLGIPWIQAPGEAEAQCAAMCKAGLVYATATEDMDALTFGSPRLVRHLTYSEARKLPVVELDLSKVLSGLEVSMDQFIDICILCGCDYISSIRGIGPKKSFQMIKQHGNIENLLKHLDTERYKVGDDFLFQEARKLFNVPDVLACDDMKLEWREPNEDGVVAYLVGDKGFQEERVRNGLVRLKNSKKVRSQQRLDSFFKSMPTPKTSKRKNGKSKKKKNEPKRKRSKK